MLNHLCFFFKSKILILLILLLIISNREALGLSPKLNIDKHTWELQKVFGKSRMKVGSPNIIVKFIDSTFTVKMACNTLNGVFYVKNDSIHFYVKFMTYKSCSKKNIEDQFIHLIKTTSTYRIRGNLLYLYNERKKIAIFKLSCRSL